MQVQILKGKIHCARLTDSHLDYEGSLGVDIDILEAADILPYEKILIVNATNGARLETYAIPEERGTRTFCLNGAAARRGMIGDKITIMAFGFQEATEAKHHKPTVIVLDKSNNIVNRK